MEFGLAIAALLAASSLTSVPPGIDLTEDRVTWQEIVDRNWPIKPTWTSHPGRSLIPRQPAVSADGSALARPRANADASSEREARPKSSLRRYSAFLQQVCDVSMQRVDDCVVTAFRPIPVAPGAWDRRVDGR